MRLLKPNFLFFRTKHLDEALGYRNIQSRRNEEGVHPHIDQSRDYAGGIIGVEGRKHNVTGKRGLHRELCRFFIPNLANHDNVGVLAENGTETARKSIFDLGTHLALIDTVHVVLYWIFQADNVITFAVEFMEY